MSDQPDQPDQPDLGSPPLHLSLAWASQDLVAGFPLWLELELDNPDPHLSLSGLGALTLGGRCPDLRVVVRQGEAVVASSSPSFRSDLHGLPYGGSLGPSQRRAGIVDLDALVGLAPGHYQIQVDYPATSPFSAQAILELELEAPTEAEADAAKRRPPGGWIDAVLHPQRTLTEAAMLGGPRAHAALLLHARLWASTWAREHDAHELATLFDNLPRGLSAPADLLRYELAALEGEVVGSEAHANLLARWPAWGWWLEQLESGQGPLARLRARRHTEPEDSIAPLD